MILMYHHVCPRQRIPVSAEPSEGWEYTLTPEGFRRQLEELARRGFQFISLDSLVDAIRSSGKEPPKTAVVTFDDGWIDNHAHALPVLRALDIPATFFIATGHVREGKADARRMTPDHWRELSDAGMTLGGHTRSHPDLTTLGEKEAVAEIAGCKKDLEAALGAPVRFFAYPGGAFDARVARWTREAGYDAACSILGPARNTTASLFWLYRDALTETMDTWRDRYRLSSLARRAFAWRVEAKLKRMLGIVRDTERAADGSPRDASERGAR